GVGLVVNSATVLGDDVLLRQGVTIGSRKGRDAPIVGNDVHFGPNSVALGAITIGNHSRIGAGAVVIDDVAENSAVVAPKAMSRPRRSQPVPEVSPSPK